MGLTYSCVRVCVCVRAVGIACYLENDGVLQLCQALRSVPLLHTLNLYGWYQCVRDVCLFVFVLCVTTTKTHCLRMRHQSNAIVSRILVLQVTNSGMRSLLILATLSPTCGLYTLSI
jgi:hypothetical protein